MSINKIAVLVIAMVAMTGIAAAYGTANVQYSGSDGEFTITTYAPNVNDVQTCTFAGTVNGYQTVTEGTPNWRGATKTTIERITTTTGISAIDTESYIITPCPWDEDGVFVAGVTSNEFARLSQLGSAQGIQNSHQQPTYLNFGATTSTGVTDLYADGEYTMNLQVAQFVPGGATEAETYVNMDGVTNGTAYLGSARMQLGDGWACHGTGFRNYYPGYNNELPGFVLSDPDGNGTIVLSAFEGAAVWGSPYLQVQTEVNNDGITTVSDVNAATGYVYHVYTYDNSTYGEGHMLAH